MLIGTGLMSLGAGGCAFAAIVRYVGLSSTFSFGRTPWRTEPWILARLVADRMDIHAELLSEG